MAFILSTPNSFDFETKHLGKIKISPYPPFGPKGFSTKLRGEKLSSEELFRDLVKQLGEKDASKTDQSAKKKISSKDVKLITKTELQNIAKVFVKKNEWLLKNIAESATEQENVKLIKKNTESFIDYAIRILKNHDSEWSKKLNETASSFKSVIEFSTAKMSPLVEQLRDNMAISGNLGSLLSSSSPLQARRFLAPELDKISKIDYPLGESKFQVDIRSYLDEFLGLIRSTAVTIKSLNDTTVQTSASTAKTQTTNFRVAIVTMILTMFAVIIAFWTSNDNTVSQGMTNTFDSLKTQITKQDSNLTKVEKANQRLTARLDSILNQTNIIEVGGSITTPSQIDSVSANRK